jgi:pimeloyl-ACP methyl ester carboxylesterase
VLNRPAPTPDEKEEEIVKVISKDGTRLDVAIEGPERGAPVVLLHGVSSSRSTYDWLPETVLRGRRVIRADFRGHGASDRSPGRYGLRDYYEDTVAILEQAAGRPAAIVGFSLGGCTAWMTAQERPDLVTGILMEDPPLYGGEPAVHEAAGIAAILRRSIDQEIEWTDRGTTIDEAASVLAKTPMGPDRVFSDVLLADSIRSLAESTVLRDRGAVESAISREMLDGLDTASAIQRPALLLAGNDDFGSAFTRGHELRLAASHPDVSVVRLSQCGHGLQTWKRTRDTYLTLLLGFLSRYAPVPHA